MNIASCNPYHAVVEDATTLRGADGKSAFKVYFVSIIGRDTPERFQWDSTSITQAETLQWLGRQNLEGVGFILTFPHITKIFRFSPQAETILNVMAFSTQTHEKLSLDRPEGYTEFACLAEALVAAEEYAAWAKAETVQQYLATTAQTKDAPVASPDKMKTYFNN